MTLQKKPEDLLNIHTNILVLSIRIDISRSFFFSSAVTISKTHCATIYQGSVDVCFVLLIVNNFYCAIYCWHKEYS